MQPRTPAQSRMSAAAMLALCMSGPTLALPDDGNRYESIDGVLYMAPPPTPEWGTMLASARDFIGRAHWVVLAPGGAILTAVLCVNVVGDALGDALDPRRGTAKPAAAR